MCWFKALAEIIGRRKGLSNIVTSLILMVMAILLVMGVAYYSIKTVNVGSQREEMHFRDVHV